MSSRYQEAKGTRAGERGAGASHPLGLVRDKIIQYRLRKTPTMSICRIVSIRPGVPDMHCHVLRSSGEKTGPHASFTYRRRNSARSNGYRPRAAHADVTSTPRKPIFTTRMHRTTSPSGFFGGEFILVCLEGLGARVLNQHAA